MPPSDNVVRCGLTRKHCDPPLFFQLCDLSFQSVIVKNYPFDHPVLNDYFRVNRPQCYFYCRKDSIVLILEGEGTINQVETKRGDSWLIENTETILFSRGLEVIMVSPPLR